MHEWEGSNGASWIQRRLGEYPAGVVHAEAYDAAVGAGADISSIVLTVLSVGSLVFFGLPEAHKRIREALSEWKLMKQNYDALLAWIAKRCYIHSQPIEAALLTSLGELETTTDVSLLRLSFAQTIIGRSGYISPQYDNSEVVFHELHFREDDRKLYILIVDQYLHVIQKMELVLDPLAKYIEDQAKRQTL